MSPMIILTVGIGGPLTTVGRLSSSIAIYRNLLGIRSVTVVSNSVLQLEYDIKGDRVATLVLQYDEKTKRLENAQVSWTVGPTASVDTDDQLLGSDLSYEDIMEATDVAIKSNDVTGLVADLLSRLR